MSSRSPSTGMPVVCCSLHSQVAPVCAGVGDGVRVAYLQLPGGALPVSLSDAVRALKERGLVETAVAVGACFDGDVHCVSTASALSWTKAARFDAAVCAIGPGIVGTGTLLGHGGVAAAEAANAAMLSAAGRSWRRASRKPTSASDTAESRITRRPCWPSVSARSRSRTRTTPKAGARPAPGCRSPTWAAGPTRTPRSSPPPTPPGGSHAA